MSPQLSPQPWLPPWLMSPLCPRFVPAHVPATVPGVKSQLADSIVAKMPALTRSGTRAPEGMSGGGMGQISVAENGFPKARHHWRHLTHIIFTYPAHPSPFTTPRPLPHNPLVGGSNPSGPIRLTTIAGRATLHKHSALRVRTACPPTRNGSRNAGCRYSSPACPFRCFSETPGRGVVPRRRRVDVPC
jgi:hypothetical protein